MLLLTDRARLICQHAGMVQIVTEQNLVWCEEHAVLVEVDPEAKTIVGCPNINVGIKPCTSTLRVKVGYSSFLRIDGRRVCLASVRGLTDGTPPGVVEYRVVDAGQQIASSLEAS